jgi:DNA-binding transcriptional ArsR family regulator
MVIQIRVRSRRATTPLDHLFHALSDPTRREILATLARREANLTELARRSRLSFAAVRKHVTVLERARLVRRRADRRDGRAVVLELRPAPLQAGAEWLERHRRFWQERLGELEAFVSARYVPGKGDAGGPPGR